MAARDCPDCTTRLTPFWLPSRRDGAELELDRCNTCGGVWFDAGELSSATRHTVRASREETDRQCPTCQVPLVVGELGRVTPVTVETCLECKGTFLEARDLDALLHHPRVQAGPAPAGTGFVCDDCGQRKPLSFARPTLTGLSCEACVQGAAPRAAEKVEAVSGFSRFLGWLRS